MKKGGIEFLDFFEEDEKRKVGRSKLADSELKKKSLIIACVSFLSVVLLLIFGYGTLVGFDTTKLLGMASSEKSKTSNKKVLIYEIKPIIKKVTIKEGTARKLYLTVMPANATNKNIEYKSSDNSIVQIDKNGRATGISEGSATVTATTKDGSKKSAKFKVEVIKDIQGKCNFTSLNKTTTSVDYEIECNYAKIKEIQYKVDDEYKPLTSKKLSDSVKLSEKELDKNITFKVLYYPNNSKIAKYSTKTLKSKTTTTKKIDGGCSLGLKDVKSNSAKYSITCKNASISKIAYKIGDGSYIGIKKSNLADTILFEESNVTRVLYFNVEYKIDGTEKIKTITESSIIGKK